MKIKYVKKNVSKKVKKDKQQKRQWWYKGGGMFSFLRRFRNQQAEPSTESSAGPPAEPSAEPSAESSAGPPAASSQATQIIILKLNVMAAYSKITTFLNFGKNSKN